MERLPRANQVDYQLDVACITIRGAPDDDYMITQVFESLAAKNIDVDIVLKNTKADRTWDLSFTIGGENSSVAMNIVEGILTSRAGGNTATCDRGLGKATLVGASMQDAPGYASRMFRALADENINIEMIATSDIKIACLVLEDRMMDAVRALREAFLLDP